MKIQFAYFRVSVLFYTPFANKTVEYNCYNLYKIILVLEYNYVVPVKKQESWLLWQICIFFIQLLKVKDNYIEIV